MLLMLCTLYHKALLQNPTYVGSNVQIDNVRILLKKTHFQLMLLLSKLIFKWFLSKLRSRILIFEFQFHFMQFHTQFKLFQ